MNLKDGQSRAETCHIMVDRRVPARCASLRSQSTDTVMHLGASPMTVRMSSLNLSGFKGGGGDARLLASYDSSEVECEKPSLGLRFGQPKSSDPWPFVLQTRQSWSGTVRPHCVSITTIEYPCIPAPTPALGRARSCGFVHAALHKRAISLPALTIDLGSLSSTTGHGTGRVI